MRERLVLVLALGAWQLAFVLRGVSLADAGTVLAGQWDLVGRGYLNPYSGVILLSDLLGGLWQSLREGPSLLWARLGGAILICASSVAALELAARRHDRRRALAAVLSTGLLVVVLARYDLLIHYLTVPALLSLGVLGLVGSRAAGDGGFRGRAAWAGAGVLCVLLALARLPFVSVLLIPPGLALFASVRGREPRRAWARCRWFAYGAAATVLLATALLAATGLLGQYVGRILPGGDGTIGAWFSNAPRETLLRQAHRALRSSAWLGAWIALLLAAAAWVRAHRPAVGALLATAWVAGLIFVHSDGPGPALLRFTEVLWAGSTAGAALLAWAVRREDPARARMLGWGAALYAVLPLGSSVGLTSAAYGLWFCLPAALLGAGEATARGAGRLAEGLRPVVPRLALALGLAAVVLHLMPRGWSWEGFVPVPRQLAPAAAYRTPGLEGVSDAPEAVSRLDAALAALRELARPGDTILAFNFLPLVYWLTRTRPLLPAPVVFGEQRDAVPAFLAEGLRLRGAPAAVLLNLGEAPGSPQERDVGTVRDWAAGALGYRRAYANGSFEIWAPP